VGVQRRRRRKGVEVEVEAMRSGGDVGDV